MNEHSQTYLADEGALLELSLFEDTSFALVEERPSFLDFDFFSLLFNLCDSFSESEPST